MHEGPVSVAPKASVVIATYNQDRYLAQALRTILAQDLDERLFEVIVVDDGSTDKTPVILQRYRKRISVLTQARQGLVSACNLGLFHARGEYMVRMDSDDFVDSGWLRCEIEMLDRYPGACCVYPDYIQVLEDGTQRIITIQEGNLYNLIACGTLFRTEAVRAVGGFRPLYWEEYDLYLRLQGRGTFVHLAEPLYFYRKHSHSMTADTQERRAGWKELIQVWGSQRIRAAGFCSELDEVLAETHAG